MRVLFNATDAVLDSRTLQRYASALATGMPELCGGDELDLVFFTHRVFQVRSFLRQVPETPWCRPRILWLPRRVLQRRFASPNPQLRRLASGASLYHETSFDCPLLDDVPVLTTVHGLGHLESPELFPSDHARIMRDRTRRAVERSGHFICVSRKVRDELHSFYDISPERTCAIPMGIGEQFTPVAQHDAFDVVEQRFGLDGGYLLHVGGIQESHNIPFLLGVFERLVKERRFPGPLVLAGPLRYSREEFHDLLEGSGVGDRVVHLDLRPADPWLPHLYRCASVFLYPSLYDGWASSPLEAMACGTAVVASNISAIPEGVGGAAVLVHPGNELAWVEACQMLFEDIETRSQHIQLGLMRASLFTWPKTIRETWRIYRSIVEGDTQEDTKRLDEVVV